MKSNSEKLAPIIWLAFLTSVFLYIFILYSLHGNGSLFSQLDYHRIFQFDDPLALGLYALCSLAFAGYFVVPKFIKASDPKRISFTIFIVQLALLESICLYGFVLGNIQKDFQVAIPFFFISFVSIFTMNPMTQLRKPR